MRSSTVAFFLIVWLLFEPCFAMEVPRGECSRLLYSDLRSVIATSPNLVSVSSYDVPGLSHFFSWTDSALKRTTRPIERSALINMQNFVRSQIRQRQAVQNISDNAKYLGSAYAQLTAVRPDTSINKLMEVLFADPILRGCLTWLHFCG